MVMPMFEHLRVYLNRLFKWRTVCLSKAAPMTLGSGRLGLEVWTEITTSREAAPPTFTTRNSGVSSFVLTR
jgi:hypothetical protein